MSATWLTEAGADLAEFVRIVNTPTNLSDYPHAAGVEQGIVVFDGASIPGA